MKTIELFSKVGSFAENKDVARRIRLTEIVPALDNQEEIQLDFENIDSTTQSFIHALISDLIRSYGVGVLDKIYFKNCNEVLKKIIEIVVDYMQESQ